MFRSMRFCYFLTNGYRTLGRVGLKFKSTFDASTLPRTVFVPQESLNCSFDDTHEELQKEAIAGPYYSESTRYWSKLLVDRVEEIIWEEELHKTQVPKEEFINVYSVILLTCRKKQLHKHGISLFGYLIKNNELTVGLLNLFCECMLEKPEDYRCCENTVYEIFKTVIHTNKIAAKICSRALLQSEKYSNMVYECYKEKMYDEKNQTSIILSLLATNKYDEALELYVHENVRLFWVEKVFLETLLAKTVQGNDTIPAVIKFLEEVDKIKSDLVIPDCNFEILKELFSKLRALDNNYIWMVNKGIITTEKCCFCNGNLIPSNVTQEELDKLLANLEESVIVQGNIFLKSNVTEWRKFCDYIEKADYNIVLDALNVRGGTRTLAKFEKLLQELRKKNFSPLILARAHYVKYPEYKLIQDRRYPIFLTENLSDDDVFVLYAALKKGKGCYTLSNDKMRFCNKLLPTLELTNIYKRWQAIHQCKMNYFGHIIYPNSLLNGFQKSDNSKPGEFRYHCIASVSRSAGNLFCVSRVMKQKEFNTEVEFPNQRIRVVVRNTSKLS